MSDQATAVPLIERLRAVPANGRLLIAGETWSHSYPVGPLCHEAASALEQANRTPAGMSEPLARAAQALLDACIAADAAEELAENIDGSLLDAVSDALEGLTRHAVVPEPAILAIRLRCLREALRPLLGGEEYQLLQEVIEALAAPAAVREPEAGPGDSNG